MNKLLFDRDGRFIGVEKHGQKQENKLMTSNELAFMKENALHDNFLDTYYWSLYENSKRLEPLQYSNGKTQEDVVREVYNLIKNGKKIIFINGVCGTGKSSIALNLARALGKASIVVPVKGLQRQYEEDYTNKKYVLKRNGRKLKIAIITGRENHDSIIQPGISCADQTLPDTIIIAAKNKDKLFEYYKSNNLIKNKELRELKDLRRISIAPANPHWSPIYPAEYELNQLTDAKKKTYKAIFGKEHVFYHRKEGCSYYDQFQGYIDADVLIFNSKKYEIEMAIGRKPETEIDIIDEADSFLDSFSREESINLTYLYNSLERFNADEEARDDIERILRLLEFEIKSKMSIEENKIFPLNESATGKILKILLKSGPLQAEICLDEMHYANKALKSALNFENLFEESYISYKKIEKDLHADIVTTNVARQFSELCEKTKALVLMSGTLQNEEVLNNVYGIKEFAVVDAETKMPGKIDIIKSGKEMNCEYRNLSSSKEKRKEYLLALSSCIKNAKRPALVHVNAFEDLPNEYEINEYEIENIITRERLREMQSDDKNGEMVAEFKAGRYDLLFSTKCSRGVDFPGEMCNSIIFTKYPNPSIKEMFWQILKMTHQNYFWSVYKDKASREFLQRIYRALRSKDDHVYVLSPDLRVLDAAGKLS